MTIVVGYNKANMYPQDPTQLNAAETPADPTGGSNTTDPTSAKHSIHNPLSVMESGEQVICEVKRHPIGMVGIYVTTGLLLVVLAVLAFIVAPNVLTSSSRSSIIGIGGLVFIFFAAISLAFVFISNKVYWGNSWVVTSDSITEITQTSLFDKQSSQLSLGNLEDVTAQQDGPLSHMFNYGVLRVETAGERSKFVFPHCPNPSYYAKQILAAREAFEQGRSGEGEQRLYRTQGAYQEPPQPNYQPPPPSPVPPEPGYGAYQPPAGPGYPSSTPPDDPTMSSQPDPSYGAYQPSPPPPTNSAPPDTN